jgi:hypothetical protein
MYQRLTQPLPNMCVEIPTSWGVKKKQHDVFSTKSCSNQRAGSFDELFDYLLLKPDLATRCLILFWVI